MFYMFTYLMSHHKITMNHKNDCDHSHCNTRSTNESLHQTLSEMEWERGLWNAAFSGDKERVQYLLDKCRNVKETVNTVDNAGYSALHYAARNGHVDICRTLLMNGAEIDAQTRTGKATPLHKAAAAGNASTLKFLIQSGACVDLQDVDGETVLHKAVANKKDHLVDILLEACPRLRDIRNGKGQTALETNEQ